MLTRDLKGELGSKKKYKMKELYDKYRIKKKGLNIVTEELKQRMLTKSPKVTRYEQRIEQFRQNRISNLNQKKIYVELNRNGIISNDVTSTEECTKFWSDIWGVRKEHNTEEEKVSMSVEKIRKQCRKIQNWKTLGRDSVKGHWIKNFSILLERASSQMNRILMGEYDLPE